ncbi:hypothetical protein NE599_21205, partial [[Clostridium] symbiosum]|nr:hypothetical protein [[Clostridium] symbiosum]
VLFLFVAVIDLLAASFLMKPFKKLQERLNMVSEGNLDQDLKFVRNSLLYTGQCQLVDTMEI